ncbi:MAG TPA: MFS transporter [Pseudonocardia sp.]|nr:MFS transporter [Pseudonocardia sp.]
MSGHTDRRVGLGQPLRVPEFRALWVAEIVSVAGDQFARLGLSVLVFGRTGSAAWAAATYALTFLPALVGGVLLGRLADRRPRRRVMLACDLVRAVLVALMALPGTPLPVLCALLVAVVLLAPLHTAAQGALLPEVVPGPAFEAALTLRYVTGQVAQVGGFALGGLLVAALSPSAALALDAASFLASALVVRLGVAERPVPAAAGPAQPPPWSVDARAALHTVLRDGRRRALGCAAWLVGCFVVPEALAVPYAQQLGLDTAAAGLLMAADPAGSVLGGWLFIRFVPDSLRTRTIGPLALAAALPLGLCGLEPGFGTTLVLWGLSGAFATASLVQAQAEFVRVTPGELRGRAIGVAAAGLIGVQGLAVLLGGVAAQVWGARAAVALCGALGIAVALVVTDAHLRTRTIGDRPTCRAAVARAEG